MTAYLIRRSLLAVFVLWGAVTIVFLLARLAPGDPAILQLGINATDEQIAHFRARTGLDQPLIVQYGYYLVNILHFDFGQSLISKADAFQAVVERIPATARLAGAATLIALLISFPLGMLAASRPGSLMDRTISLVSISGQSLPGFWIGIMLILIFARSLRMLPSAGSDTLLHLVMPAFTLSLPMASVLVRLIRSGLLEIAHEGYIQTARAKGLPESAVIVHHALRNMMIPVVTVVGLQLGNLLGGMVVVETVFAWPGIGRLLVDAINNRDYAVVQACTLVVATVFVTLNLLVDISYQYLDPRVRAQ